MSERRENDRDEDDRSMWRTMAVASALGMEGVSLIVGGGLLGAVLDEKFGTRPWMVLAMIALAMMAMTFHIYAIARRFLDLSSDGEGEDDDVAGDR